MTTPSSWPPLIVAGRVSRLLRWRDIILTLIMWGVILLLLVHELGLAGSSPLGLNGPDTPGHATWRQRLEGLSLFVILSVVFSAVLAVFGAYTVRRYKRFLGRPPPPPLELQDQARRAGLDEAALTAAREHRIATVHVEADSRLRVE